MGDEYDDLIDSLGVPAKKAKAPLDYRALYQEVGKKHGVDPDLLYNQAKQESVNFNPHYVYGPGKSPKGAAGLSQFMPDTARQYGLHVGKGRDDRYNPRLAADAQARMMRELIDKHGDATLALSAYNSGSNKTSEQARRSAQRIPETRGYVKKIAPKGDKYDQLLDSIGESASAPEADPYDALLDSMSGAVDLQQSAPVSRRTGKPIVPVDKFAGLQSGVGAKASDTDFSSVPGSPLASMRRKPALPVNPSKIAVKPKPFRFSGPSDEQLLADLRVQVAGELAPEGGTRLLASGAGRGDEIESEAQRRLAEIKSRDARSLLGPSVSARRPGIVERAKTAITPLTPGLSSIDTPMGPKSDVIRGTMRGLTLGVLGDSREITPEERAIDPRAETKRNFAEGVGETASGFVPYVGAGKLAGMVPALNKAGRVAAAQRVGATFGGVELTREGINAAKTGEPIRLDEVAVSTAIGAAMGAIPGMNAGLKQRIVAAVAPQVVADVARGRTAEEAAQGALTNLLFEASAGRKLGLSAKRISELRQQVEGRQTVPKVTQMRLREAVENASKQESPQEVRPTNQAGSIQEGLSTRPVVDRVDVQAQPDSGSVSEKIGSQSARSSLDIPEPIRHVDLQARVKSGPNAGDFKKETRAQREQRQAQVEAQKESILTTALEPATPATASPETPQAEGARGTTLSPSKPRAKIDERTGLPLNEDGTVTLYHGTTAEGEARVRQSGKLRSAGEPDVYLTTSKEGTGYGDRSVEVRVRPKDLELDDEFPDGRRDFRVATKRDGTYDVRLSPSPPPQPLNPPRKGELDVPIAPTSEAGTRGAETIKPSVESTSTGKGVAAAAPEPATVPESPATLAAQVEALKSGTRDAVLVTPGEQRPKLPERMASVKTNVGVFYFDPAKVSRETIQAKVKDGTHGELLGHISEKPALGEPTAVVTARSPEGVEVQSSAVPPEKVSEQVAATQAQNPSAKVEVGGPELAQKVLSERVEPDFVRAARERKAQRESQKAEGIKQMHSGADPYELVDDIIIRGHEIYSEKVKPTFQQWSKRIREEFGPDSDSHLKSVWSQLSGEKGLPSTSSLKKSSLAADRERLALAEFTPAEHVAWEESLNSAKVKGLDGDHADLVAKRVLDGKQKTVDTEESAGLLLRIRELENRHEALTEKIWNETDPAKLADMRDEAQGIKEQFDNLSEASKQSKSEVARSLAFNRGAIDENYSLVGMQRGFKTDTGKEATGKNLAEIEKLHKKISDLTTDFERAQERAATAEAKLAERQVQRVIDKATRRREKVATRKELDDEFAQLVADFGRMRAEVKNSSVEYRQGGIGLPSLDPSGKLTPIVRRMVRNRARVGAVEAKALVSEIHGALKTHAEDLTERDIRELITGYGRPLGKRSELQRQLDALKSELYQGLAAEDVAAGTRSPRSEGPRQREQYGEKEGPHLSDARKLPAEGPRLSDARQVPLQGPKKSEARSSGIPLQGPHLSDVRKVRAEGPRLSDARRSGVPLQGPKITDAPKLGPRNTWPTRRAQLEKQIAEIEGKIASSDFADKPKRGATVLTPEAQAITDRLESVKNQYQNLKRRNEPGAGWRNAAAMRKAWLLSWVKTHVRNIAGTGLYQPFDELSRPLAASVDAVVGLRFGGERTIQGLSPSASIDALINGGKAGLKEFAHVMRHGATREQMELHQFTEVNTGIKAIDAAHNVIFRLMSASDRVFWNTAYRRNLIDRSTIEARNEKRNDSSIDVKQRAKELESDPQIDADAKADAYVSTFNNNNALSTSIKAARATITSKLGPKRGAMANFAIDLFLPFDRTPTNVIARVLEASPVGFYKAATKGYKEPLNPLAAARDIVNKSMTKAERREFAQTVGRAGLGSAMMVMAWHLVPKGILEVDDKDNVFLNVRGRKVNISLLSPVGQILAIGARLRAQQDKGELTVGSGAKTAGRTLADQPLLRATGTATELLRDPERSAGRTGASLAFSAVPFSGLVRGVGETIDPAEKRYPNNTFKEQFQRNVPKWRESLPASRVRLFGGKVTKATKEIERLGIKMNGATKQPDESPEDFAAREAKQNPAIKLQIENVVKMPEYDTASDEDKIKWLKQARDFASKQVQDGLPEKAEKPEQRQFPMPQSGEGVGFQRAYPTAALDRYERMSQPQRQKVYDAMARKAWTLLNSSELSDEQKAEYKARLEALKITPRPPNYTPQSFGRQYKSQLSATP